MAWVRQTVQATRPILCQLPIMTEHTYTTNEAPPAARVAAWVSFTLAALFLALIAVLHLLEPRFDPSWRMISEYEIGRHGWITQAAFVAQAISCIALLVTALPQVRTRSGRIGFAFFFAAALGLSIAALNFTGPVAVSQGAADNTGGVATPPAAVMIGGSDG
jgi:hypothetical protein